MFFKPSKYDIPSDAELVKTYRNKGDIAILGKLYHRYTALVFGVCMKYLRNEEESKDAVMQIFEKLVESLKKHEVANFKSWLHVMTKNYCLMQLRSKKKMQYEELGKNNSETNMELGYQLHPNGEDNLEGDLQAMEKAIEKLPEAQKKCIKLFYLEQKCYREIVELTNYELKKVKSYIQNGKRKIKILMEASVNENND